LLICQSTLLECLGRSPARTFRTPPVKKKLQTRYLVRNKLHQMIGDFSEEEIIRQVKMGKFSGEEEASLEGVQWRKLSSWPVFYDVLIGQALHIIPPFKGESSEADGENDSLAEPSKGAATVGSKPHESLLEGAGDHLGLLDLTQQLEGSSSEMVPRSEIEALFSRPSALQRSVKRELEKPLSDLEKPEQEPQPESAQKAPAAFLQKNPRVLIWGSVLLVLLVLFNFGLPPSKEDPERTARSEKRPGPFAGLQVEAEDQETYFSKSAEQALQMDSPIGYRKAAELFQQALEMKPKEMGLYEGATTALARSLEEDPQNKELAQELQKQLNAGRAIEPQRTAFYRAEAIAERAQGNLTKAQALLDLAIETDSLNPENLLLQAEWLLKDQKLSEAKTILESVLNWSPQSIKASVLLAEGYYLSGEFDKAKALSQKILQINPTHAQSYVLIADTLAKQNDLKAAKAVMGLAAKFADLAPRSVAAYALKRAGNLIELGPTTGEANPFYVLSWHYSDQYRNELLSKIANEPRAEEIESAKKEVLANPAYFERLGTEATQEKQLERAEGLYLAATWLFPSISKLWQRLGETREALARSREEFRWAAVTYLQAIQVDPENTDALVRLGLLETEQSNLNKAFDLLQRAAAASLEEDPEVHLALGKHLFSRKDYKAAIEQLRTARQKSPSNPEISYYQGLLYKLFDPGNPKSAMRHFEEAYSKDPNNYEALAEWLKLKVTTFEKMFAIKFMRNMIANEPKNPKLHWVMGEVYAANKEFNKAIQYYQKALDFDEKDAKIRLSLAKALASVGKLDQAVSEYKLASDLDAKNGEGYFLAAEILYQLKSFPASRDLLIGLLKIIPAYPGARRLLAMNHQAMNERDQAIAEMTKEVKANPMNYQFLLELADLLFINGKTAEAEQELTKITNLPVEKSIKDNRSPTGYRKEPTGLKGYRVRGLLLLSRLYRSTNRTEAAEGAVQSGLQLEPENMDLTLERALVYKALGRYREAAVDFTEFLKKNPNAQEAGEVRQELQRIAVEE